MRVILFLFAIASVSTTQNTNIDDKRSMWYAIRHGNLTTIKRLINDVPPNTIINWQTPVALAAQRTLLNRHYDFLGFDNSRLPILEFLLDNGGDPCLVNGQGRTPYEHYMQFVMLYPNPEVKKRLDVCNNIHHAPEFTHCAKYYGNTNKYSNCTKYPYSNNIEASFMLK